MNIAILGKMGSGKDVIGEYLIRKYGFTRYAFADNVKLIAEVWFPSLYGNGKEKPRKLLQDVGTKFREIDKNVWINAMFDDIDSRGKMDASLGYKSEDIIITDCRMPNEYEALKKRGFNFIRIDVDEETRIQRLRDRGDLFTEDSLLHDTEQHYDSFEYDYYVFNQGSKELAYEQIDRIMDKLVM